MNINPAPRLPAAGFGPLLSSEDQAGADNVVVLDAPSEDDATTSINVADDGSVVIENADGSISIDPEGEVKKSNETDDFYDNLAEKMEPNERIAIAQELILDIDQDNASRDEWMSSIQSAIKLLGLKLELPKDGAAASGDGTMSTVRHPLLLEAVLRYQANARGELLPTDGPVKVRNDDLTPESEDAELAEMLERAINNYLTVVDKTYVPDTDRMLLWVGLIGMAFKKVYHDPVLRRPVSRFTRIDDIVVNDASASLEDATRITHISKVKPSALKRMMRNGYYREVDFDLMTDADLARDAADRAVEDQQGVRQQGEIDPSQNERTLYECYVELDLPKFSSKKHTSGADFRDIPLPYRVTIDRDSREVLEIRRNWKQDDELCLPRQTFVDFLFVPGLGFYGIGLFHILGNTTAAITAAWREFLDAGMFANFPGFLYAKAGINKGQTTFRVMPGAGAAIDTGGKPINQAVMPLPYKEPGPATVQFVQAIAETGQRLGGTAEINVGEGKQDAPVGTTIALIEQAQKIGSAVHKRNHAAQATEFQLLRDLFVEDPAPLIRANPELKAIDEAKLIKALRNRDLVPQADPNTSSHMMRVMKAVGLKQLQTGAPGMYNARAVEEFVLRVLGFPVEELLVPPGQENNQVDPKVQIEQAKLQQKQATDMAMIQAKQQDTAVKAQVAAAKMQTDQQQAQFDAQREDQIFQRDTALQQQQQEREQQREAAQAAGDMAVKREEMAMKENLAEREFQRDTTLMMMEHGMERDQHAAEMQRADQEMAQTAQMHSQEMQHRDELASAKVDEAHTLAGIKADSAKQAADVKIKTAQEHGKVKSQLMKQQAKQKAAAVKPKPKAKK